MAHTGQAFPRGRPLLCPIWQFGRNLAVFHLRIFSTRATLYIPSLLHLSHSQRMLPSALISSGQLTDLQYPLAHRRTFDGRLPYPEAVAPVFSAQI